MLQHVRRTKRRCNARNHLWLNLCGRDEQGIVEPGDYSRLRAEIMAAMRDLKDPGTGEHVMAFVLSREDAPMVGLWVPHIGDLVYCYAGGYRWAGPEVLELGEGRTRMRTSECSHATEATMDRW